jgi:hypothetical protein
VEPHRILGTHIFRVVPCSPSLITSTRPFRTITTPMLLASVMVSLTKGDAASEKIAFIDAS